MLGFKEKKSDEKERAEGWVLIVALRQGSCFGKHQTCIPYRPCWRTWKGQTASRRRETIKVAKEGKKAIARVYGGLSERRKDTSQ